MRENYLAEPPYAYLLLSIDQDGRVVKALDLRSNGHMSAWVRTPLLVDEIFGLLAIRLLRLTVRAKVSAFCPCAGALTVLDTGA